MIRSRARYAASPACCYWSVGSGAFAVNTPPPMRMSQRMRLKPNPADSLYVLFLWLRIIVAIGTLV